MIRIITSAVRDLTQPKATVLLQRLYMSYVSILVYWDFLPYSFPGGYWGHNPDHGPQLRCRENLKAQI
jgi:hypothetical protein